MTLDIKQLIKQRQQLHKPSSRDEYTRVSNLVKSKIVARKKIYYQRKYSSKNPKWWSVVNGLRNPKQNDIDDNALATELNNGFHSVWSGGIQPDISSFTSRAPSPINESIFSPANVSAALTTINCSAPGPDGISGRLLKSPRLELSAIFAHLFTCFLVAGFVPDQWRAANITPIAKVDHPCIWSDFRPISLVSNMCKVFEKIIAHIIIIRTTHIWRTNRQHGFLPGKCTMDALIKVLFDIGKALDDGKSTVIAIFFDFAKAFDLVPHDLLLLKLDKVLPSWLVKWIAAYLSNRKQRVRINNFETEWKPVEAGVIQGSVLGPILFLIFIADVNDYIPAGVDFEKYADDIINYVIGRATSSFLPQQAIDGVQRWCQVNGMRLNVSKCKVLHFPASAKDFPPTLVLDNNALEVVDSYKYLGVEINSSLDSSQQWARVYSLISSVPFLIKQLKQSGLKANILVNTYRSLVLSHLSYSATVLATTTDAIKHEMTVFQNRILRIIGISKATALTEHNILEVTQFLEMNSTAQVRKLLEKSTPLAASLATTAVRRINHAFKYDIPRARTKKFNDSPVLKTLRLLRDECAAASRTIRPPPSPILTQLPRPATPTTSGARCSNPRCKQPAKLWKRVDLQERACLRDTTLAT